MTYLYTYSEDPSGAENAGYLSLDVAGLDLYISQFAERENVSSIFNASLAVGSVITLSGSFGPVFVCTSAAPVSVDASSRVSITLSLVTSVPGRDLSDNSPVRVSVAAPAPVSGVTSVSAGTGLVATPSPIVGVGSLALANTAVVAGAYTSSNITVDAQGRITAAASGSSGTQIIPAAWRNKTVSQALTIGVFNNIVFDNNRGSSTGFSQEGDVYVVPNAGLYQLNVHVGLSYPSVPAATEYCQLVVQVVDGALNTVFSYAGGYSPLIDITNPDLSSRYYVLSLNQLVTFTSTAVRFRAMVLPQTIQAVSAFGTGDSSSFYPCYFTIAQIGVQAP